MQVHPTGLPDLLLLEPIPHHDDRGWFSRTFDASIARSAGIDPDGFVQDSQSRSHRGVVRGLHGRRGGGESKLVRCAHGTIHDVVVDARPQSPTFGRWQAFELDDVTLRSLYIPPGFLHGFQVLTPTADICYRIDAEHNPDEDLAVRWDDPELAVHWPLPASTVSERDQAAGSWTDLRRLLVPAAPR